MWNLANEQKFIKGSLRELLVESAHLMMHDLGEPMSMTKLKDSRTFDCRYNEIFLNLSMYEQVYAIHFVLDHIFDEGREAPELRMWMDAAIDMLFNRVERALKRACKKAKYDIRKLVIDAYREHYTREDMMDEYEMSEEVWGADDEMPYTKGAHKVRDIQFWLEVVESLRDVVLHDRDFEDVVMFDDDSVDEEREDLLRSASMCEGGSVGEREAIGLVKRIIAM